MIKMAYSDKEITAFTQVAYMNDIEELVDTYRDTHGLSSDAKVPLSELYDKLDSSSKEKYDYIKNELGCDIEHWEIVGTHDQNSKNGFSAYIIEASPGNAAVAFRGSDSMESYLNVKTDWVDADLKLLNSTCTQQQAEVDTFLAEYKKTLNGYDNITMTGHSLGGNLAEYATIVSSEYGLDDNIEQCVSMDGPGFSDEFIRLYKDKIAKMSGKMVHHRWSFVGTMLNDLPGVTYDYVQVTGDYNCVNRHSTEYLDFDKITGQLKPGEQDGLSKFTSTISEGIDHMPKIVGDVLVTVVGGIWCGAMWAKENVFDENGNLTPSGFAIIAGSTAIVSIFSLGTVLTVALETVVALVVVIAAAFVFELTYDLIMTAVDAFCDTAGQMYNWAKDKVAEFKNAVISTIDNAKDWWNNNFNSGYKYSSTNPQIRVDTAKLRTYAERLTAVNKRLGSLDKRMDALYLKVGLRDLFNLLQADLLTGSSGRISNCAKYLNETANDFDTTERNVVDLFGR